jgi:hypothetical protein
MLNCQACSYNCKYQSEFNRHLNSKKHKERIESKLLCSGCYKEFTTKFNKSRHEKKCNKVIQNNQTADTINNIDTQNNQSADTINNTNIHIENLNINIPALENIEDKYKKYYVMEISEMIKQSVSDYVSKEVNKQLLHEKCDVMEFADKITDKIRMNYFSKFNNYNKCKNCKLENGYIVYACDTHRLNHEEAIKSIVEILTDNPEKNICITSLKKYDNDDGDILIKHANALYNLGILNFMLETCKYGFLVEFDVENLVSQKVIIDLYQKFYKKLEAVVNKNKRKFNKKS